MQEKFLGELIFARIPAGPVFALARIQENVFEDHCPHIGQILEGIHFGANTCRACIRTRANTGKYSWRTIYVLVACQGVIKTEKLEKPKFCTLFLKKAIFRKLPDSWAQKKQKMITGCAKNRLKPLFLYAKHNLAQIITPTWPR